MPVGISTELRWTPLDDPAVVHSFFSSICVNLENSVWGARFPAIMQDLYQGVLPQQKLAAAATEISQISAELEKCSPASLVWDVEDQSETPPPEFKYGTAANLSAVFVGPDGRTFCNLIALGISFAQEEDSELRLADLESL
jgi:hypothetical protein